MSLLSSLALQETAKVMTFGETKYAAHNWRGGMDYSRLMDAMLRHWTAINNGELIDPESGLYHWAHIICCASFLIEYEMTKTGNNDLWKGAKK